jgi:hypothetical protein
LGGLQFETSLGKKLARPHLNKKSYSSTTIIKKGKNVRHGGMCLSSQVQGRHEYEDHGPSLPRQKHKTLCKK